MHIFAYKHLFDIIFILLNTRQIVKTRAIERSFLDILDRAFSQALCKDLILYIRYLDTVE